MNTVGERLEIFLQNKGHNNIKAFCEQHGLVYTTIVQTIGGRRLGMKVLDSLVEIFPGLNVNWLLYNRGPMEVKYDFPEWIAEAAMAMATQLKKDKALREKALIFLNENSVKGQ